MQTKFLLFLILIAQALMAQPAVNFSYDLTSEPVEYKHYWKSTGYSPAWMTTNVDYQLYLNLLKAAKLQAVEYTRPHYLLNHVDIKKPGTPEQSYDWAELDGILDLLTDANLKLIFEIMMVPHPYFDEWYDRTKLDAWSKFCTDLILHLQDRYGRETVRSWYFESTNEPDGRHFWKYGPLEFLYYYDATAAGIKKADPELKFGGPGNARGLNTIYEVFVQHVYDNFNYYTQDTGVVADFITWHRKEKPHEMIANEQVLNDYLNKKYFRDSEKLANMPIGNDESDPLAGWGRPFWWRPTPWYAGFVTQITDLHNQFFVDSLNKDYLVLSNDNAFMGDWYRRTHVARFIPGDNAIMQKRSSQRGGSWSNSSDTRPETEQFYLIKKPDYTAMALLAMQGNKRFLPKILTKDSTAGAMVSKNDAGEYFILTYNKPEIEIDRNKRSLEPSEAETKRYQSQSKSIVVELEGIPQGDYQVIQYKIDEDYGNPFKVWKSLGSPEDPTTDQIKQIQAYEDPALVLSQNNRLNDRFKLTDRYPSAGVTLTFLAKKPQTKPQTIQDLEYHTYRGLHDESMVMLNWNHTDDLHIKSYDVFFSPQKNGTYTKVNQYDVFEKGFLHFDGKKGFYKVQAVDHWDRTSPHSETIEVN